jgi:hypothetical protein
MDRSGSTWRFVLAGVCLALPILDLLPVKRVPESHQSEWSPVMWVVFLPLAIALAVSGMGIRFDWSPIVLFRLLPFLVLAGLFLLGAFLGA